jgi:TonB family protein
MKAFIALMVVALVTACVSAPPANAPKSATKSSCEAGEGVQWGAVTPEQMKASEARFVKLCVKSRGTIYSNSRRDLTRPSKMIGPNPLDFYPPSAKRLGETGSTYVSCVVEIDGRLSSPFIVSPSGFPDLDAAALKWLAAAGFKSPAYLNSKPVRMYFVFRVDFIQRD